jgi:hypothetical protein
MNRSKVAERVSRQPARQRTPISKASNLEELAAFWDKHDISEFKAECPDVTDQFEVDIRYVRRYVAVEPQTWRRATRLARKRGLSAERLINLWLREASKRA